MKSSPPKSLIAVALLACLIIPPVRPVLGKGVDTSKDAALIEASFSTNGLEITRSVIQPLRRFFGERMELSTSIGDTVKEKFYGVVMILKYQVKQAKLARSMTFTERVYLVEETHDFGTWKYYERSWSPDEQGIWTDVLGLGDETPLPADYKRVLRQEIYCNGKIFSNNLITFTPEAIEFRPMSLGAGRLVKSKE